MRRVLLWIVSCFVLHGVSHAQDLTPGEIYLLVKGARPNVTEPDGWASDLHEVLSVQGLPITRENVCASIAIIDQESNFVANPTVAGLGALSEKSLRAKMDRVPILGRMFLEFLDTHPTPQTSYLQHIRTARTERDLDLTYRAMVNDAGTASNLSLVVQSGLLNRMIEERNDISTVGSMQVSVKFALDKARARRWLPMTLSDVYAVRDDLYTRRGGMYYGVMQLLGYNSGYAQKVFRFADYNAGRYSSRNAAFQSMVTQLLKQKLARDGDLLLYDSKGDALGKASGTEVALRALIKKNGMKLSDAEIRADLNLEKSDDFATSKTYIAVKGLFFRTFGKPAPFAQVPEITLSSVKLTHTMTTANFANSVDRRYKKCMATK